MRPSILSQSSHSIQESRRLFQRRVFGRNSVVKKITIALAAGILLSACTALGADIPFTKIVIDNNTISNPWAKAMADIDGDGYMDMIVAPSNGSVIWYHYPDWTEYTIGSGGTECGIAVADIDGDGDMDVVVGPVWYENPRPAGDPRTSPWIAHSLGQNNHNVVVDFLDGDDKRDIVMVSEAGTTVYIFKQNTPTSWTRRNINPGVGSNGLAVADIDRDGKNDIVVPGKWLRNPGDIINGTWQTYTFGTWNNMACIAVADLNGDHWPDIIMTVAEGSGPVVWFENPGNPTVNTNWVRHTIDSENLTQAHTLFAADFNLDGKIDMVVSEFGGAGRVIVYQNQGSGLSWVRQVVGTTSLHNMAIGDYDNDGDIDLFGAQAYNNPPAEVWRNDTRTGSAQPSRVLVFSKTAGFRHESIPDCIAAVESLGAMNNFLVDATEDASVFTASNLNQYSAVVFCLTTGDVLDNTQQAAFQSFIESGKGWVGLHSACDTEYDWAWYGKLVGAYFNSEYSGGDINLTTVNFNHPSTGTMPASWTNQNDSVYKYSNDPTDNGATILVTADLGDGQAHPYSWYHDYNGGRAWYTAGGGDSNGFHEALFLKHLEGGINYARGVSVTVTAPPTLTSIIVSPSSASVVVNGKQQFTATAKDQFGNALVPQPSFTWTVTGGGTISSSGLFTAGSTAGGLFTVTATSGSVSGTASMTVTAPLILTSISVSPSPASVAANGTQQFMATAKDQFGGAMSPQPSFTWTVSGGGTINSNGLFTAGSTAGGPFTVTAASGGVSGTASVTVTTVSSFTIGETNILSTNDNGNGNLLVAQQASLGQTATILSMSFYVTTASGNLRLGIYDATGPNGGPGKLKAQTAGFTPKSGWNTQNVVSQVSLPAGTYWLAYLPSSNSLGFKVVGSGSAKWYSYSYQALPVTFSTSPTSGTYHWSFYATLQ